TSSAAMADPAAKSRKSRNPAKSTLVWVVTGTVPLIKPAATWTAAPVEVPVDPSAEVPVDDGSSIIRSIHSVTGKVNTAVRPRATYSRNIARGSLVRASYLA